MRPHNIAPACQPQVVQFGFLQPVDRDPQVRHKVAVFEVAQVEQDAPSTQPTASAAAAAGGAATAAGAGTAAAAGAGAAAAASCAGLDVQGGIVKGTGDAAGCSEQLAGGGSGSGNGHDNKESG